MAIIWISTRVSIWISILWNSQKQIPKTHLWLFISHVNICTWNIINTPRLHYLTFLSGTISTVIVSLLVYIVVCMLKRESRKLFFLVSLLIEYLLHIFKDQKMDRIMQSLCQDSKDSWGARKTKTFEINKK